MKRNSYLFIVIFAVALSAFGPLVTDMYLPALPHISSELGAPAYLVQLSLTVSLIGLGLGQLLIGPLSDKFGRRNPLLLSMAAFVVSSVGCVFAWNIESLIISRLVQGLAGGGGNVISRSIAADLYEGKELLNFLAVLAAIMGIAPVVSPLAGAAILAFADWRGIFIAILAVGLIIFFTSLAFRETLPEERRQCGKIAARFAYMGVMLRHRKFMRYVLILGFCSGMFFGYLSASPFVFQEYFGLSPFAFSMIFALNSIGLALGSQLPRFFRDPRQAINVSVWIMLPVSVITAVLLAAGASVYAVEAAFFILVTANGILFPVVTALALNLERENSGNASAFIGFFDFIIGALMTFLAGIGNVMISCGIILVGCTAVCFYFTRAGRREA